MMHIAIDLGGRESQFCIRNDEAAILEEGRISTKRIGAWLKDKPKGRVILETCAEAFAIADKAMELGHEVKVVPATLCPTLGVGSRRTKTDQRDARVLSEVSCQIDLPSVHIRSQLGRDHISMYRAREGMVQSRTKLVNIVRGWMRTQLLSVKTGGVRTFPKRVRKLALGRSQGLPQYIERLLMILEELCDQITPR